MHGLDLILTAGNIPLKKIFKINLFRTNDYLSYTHYLQKYVSPSYEISKRMTIFLNNNPHFFTNNLI